MKPKTTKCPSPAYKPLKLDLATRLAQQRASEHQPPLQSLASSVPSSRPGEGWK